MSRFDTFLASVLDRAGREARADGSSTVEAQHLLLAIAAGEEAGPRELLAEAGLDEPAIRAALDNEFAQSLGAAGVSVDRADMPRPEHPRGDVPPLGASVKLALERGIGSVSRKQDLQPAHLLIGILQAPVGTVPRALALSGIDRTVLIHELQQRVASESGKR